MLGHRLRYWPNIKPALMERLVKRLDIRYVVILALQNSTSGSMIGGLSGLR